MVLATCRAVLKDEHDAEDAFQATFLVLARKARSVRGSDALGGWLHRVAYRASVQASIEARRRRRKEAEAAMARRDPSRPDIELAARLLEEIDRLPESLRLPVVLCDLEGLTYEEAAGQLGWTLPKIRHRLAEARQRLKGRLAGRGALPLAIGANLAPKVPSAVPASLVGPAVASATGGAASPVVALLAHTILRGMLVTKIKLTTAAVLAAVAFASAGVIAAGKAPGKPETDPTPAAQANPAAKDAPAKDDLIDVRGIVLSPDGKPVAGATVYAVQPAPVPETTSGPDGRFHLRVPHPEPAFKKLLKQYPQVVASAPGFGSNQAAPPYPADPTCELTIKLVEDGPAIEGRVLDLEGRPVVGARVHPNTVYFAEGGSLDPWIGQVKDKEGKGFEGLHGLVIVKGEVKTGPDGRFRLTGLGRERVASLFVTGPTIAHSEVNVLLRDGPGFQGVDVKITSPCRPRSSSTTRRSSTSPCPRPSRSRGPSSTRTPAARSRASDLVAQVYRAAVSTVNGPTVSGETDAQGRYRLTGLVKAPAYRLSAGGSRKRDWPYLSEGRKAVASSPGPGARSRSTSP